MGGATPGWGTRTPNPYNQGTTPAWNSSSRTPNPYANGGKTPAWDTSARTPNPYASGAGNSSWGGATPGRPAGGWGGATPGRPSGGWGGATPGRPPESNSSWSGSASPARPSGGWGEPSGGWGSSTTSNTDGWVIFFLDRSSAVPHLSVRVLARQLHRHRVIRRRRLPALRQPPRPPSPILPRLPALTGLLLQPLPIHLELIPAISRLTSVSAR
jgi:hypothetical protein